MGTIILILILVAVVFVMVHVARTSPSHEQTQRELAAKMADVNVDDLMFDIEKLKLKTEVLIQSDIVGDTKTHDAIVNDTYDGPLPEKRADGGWLSIYDELRILKIAGINHRKGISRYVGRVDCVLVPEPENEFDPDAIKVVAEDRHHLGYIPSNQTDFVRSMTGENFPYRCTAFIESKEDETDSHQFFIGFVYIKKA